MRRVWIAALVLYPLVVSAADQPVRLHYRANEPVVQQSRLSVDMTQRPGPKELRSTVYQETTAKLTSDGQTSAPYGLTVELTRLRLGQEGPKGSQVYDSLETSTSPFFQELTTLIGQPLQVTLGENLQVTDSSGELNVLIKDLRLLKGFSVSNLISEITQPLFALAGQDLKVGTTYTRTLKLGSGVAAPVELTYRVVGITNSEVRATVEAKVADATLQLPSGALGAGPSGPPALVKVSGKIDGKAVWSRHNALVFKTKIESVYNGVVVREGQQEPFELRLSHFDSSQRQ